MNDDAINEMLHSLAHCETFAGQRRVVKNFLTSLAAPAAPTSQPNAAAQEQQAGPTIILLSTGEYSDYGVMGAFRPCKAFNVGETLEVFKAQWTPDADSYSLTPGPNDFAGWLAKEGYVEDARTEEIHLGSYGDVELSKESKELTFAPTPTGMESVSSPSVGKEQA